MKLDRCVTAAVDYIDGPSFKWKRYVGCRGSHPRNLLSFSYSLNRGAKCQPSWMMYGVGFEIDRAAIAQRRALRYFRGRMSQTVSGLSLYRTIFSSLFTLSSRLLRLEYKYARSCRIEQVKTLDDGRIFISNKVERVIRMELNTFRECIECNDDK